MVRREPPYFQEGRQLIILFTSRSQRKSGWTQFPTHSTEVLDVYVWALELPLAIPSAILP